MGEALDWGYPATYNDDVIQLWLGIGSQIDGLSHFGLDGHHYNRNDAREFASITGATAMSVHNIPPLVGRGVLFDMVSFFGGDPLEAGRGISAQDIKDAEQKSGVKIGKGDVVLFHTGWVDSKMTSDPVAFMAGEPGITNDAAEYLARQDVMAVGSDTCGVGVSPAVAGDKLHYEHVILPKENGIYILEGMNTGPLAAEDVVEFMFVLGQPRVEGTVQMIINPVALW
ncbi:cyclase family protein [Roseovarius pelagicus]|uniref:Cyclase family protein n=1 Tax=Roseovarius pelagicus TaxID=2980108 RepID=A0ABY6D790_9RHOB|nr:cyclase family protein [Roseovarius pelagicus]UXX81480.1 cyclase family protein [Roseovarius pelagicus]